MDDADRAGILSEIALQASIEAARGIPAKARTHCSDCGTELLEHRRPRGRCLECQEAIEAKQRAYATGV